MRKEQAGIEKIIRVTKQTWEKHYGDGNRLSVNQPDHNLNEWHPKTCCPVAWERKRIKPTQSTPNDY